MPDSKRIFIDTSGWIELLLEGERYHLQVAKYFSTELKQESKFFTSDYVLDETWTRLITQQSFHSAKTFKEKLEEAQKQRQLLILWTDETHFEESWQSFAKLAEHKLSFTDASIITFIHKLKIDEILTLDQGFQKAGLTVQPRLI